MAHTPSDLPPARHVPANTNQGWPVAFAIIVLAIVINTTAFIIHERAGSRAPIDPEFRAKGAGVQGGETGGSARGASPEAPAQHH